MHYANHTNSSDRYCRLSHGQAATMEFYRQSRGIMPYKNGYSYLATTVSKPLVDKEIDQIALQLSAADLK